MKKSSYLLLIFSLFCSIGIAQTIHGRIVDSASNKPVAGASIYVNGSYTGTTSKADGTFQFEAPQDKVPVIISHVGYQTQSTLNYKGNDFVVVLSPKALNEVTINYGSMSREQEMKIFSRQFIGSASDKDCVIENPEDLHFTYYKKKDSLVAKADKPLIIDNKKLGYKITYFLSDFYSKRGKMSYNGNYFFQEDVAGLNPQQLENVKHQRNMAYTGSRMEFIRALYKGDLRNERYWMQSYNGLLAASDVLVKKGKDVYFYPQNVMLIEHMGAGSTIRSTTHGSGSYITASGYYDSNITWQGYMSTDRINKLLPLEFQPEERLLAQL